MSIMSYSIIYSVVAYEYYLARKRVDALNQTRLCIRSLGDVDGPLFECTNRRKIMDIGYFQPQISLQH
jgi:hypothetical protein